MKQATNRLSTYLLHNAAPHRFGCEKANGPPGSALGRGLAGHGQNGNGLPSVQDLASARTGGLQKRFLKTALLKLPFDAVNGHEREAQDLGNTGGRRSLVQSGQDLGSLNDPNGCLTFMQQLIQLFSLRRVESHPLGPDVSRSHTYKKQFSSVSYLDKDVEGLERKEQKTKIEVQIATN
jgi:hypothetical protein